MGASLLPDYFASKVNLFIGLAPVSTMTRTPKNYLVEAAKVGHLNSVVTKLVSKENYFNWFKPMPTIADSLALFCSVNEQLCAEYYTDVTAHDGVDNPDAMPNFIATWPSGSTYRSFVYYAQTISSGSFAKYDFGPLKNERVYGTKTAPLIPLSDYKVPSVLLYGDMDALADPADVKWLASELGENVVFMQEYHLDHMSFALAKDNSFF